MDTELPEPIAQAAQQLGELHAHQQKLHSLVKAADDTRSTLKQKLEQHIDTLRKLFGG